MKKILLGLTILSAMAYATGTTVTAPASEDNQTTGVQIITRATVISSGLMIATTADGNTILSTIPLNHGSIGAVETAKMETDSSVFYIKRANNQERLGRIGHQLTVALTHDGILKHETHGTDEGKDSSATLNHSLNLSFTFNNASGTENPSNSMSSIITTAGSGDSSPGVAPLTNNDYVVTGSIKSLILEENMNKLLAGNYVNDALITVTISKPN